MGQRDRKRYQASLWIFFNGRIHQEQKKQLTLSAVIAWTLRLIHGWVVSQDRFFVLETLNDKGIHATVCRGSDPYPNQTPIELERAGFGNVGDIQMGSLGRVWPHILSKRSLRPYESLWTDLVSKKKLQKVMHRKQSNSWVINVSGFVAKIAASRSIHYTHLISRWIEYVTGHHP